MASSIQRRVSIVSAIALLAVAAGGFLLLRPGGPSDASAVARPQSDGSGARPMPAPAVSADGSAPAPAAQRTDALAPEWNDASHDVVGPVVEGTIVVTDRENVKHAEEDGSFVPDFIDGPDSELPDGERGRRRVAVRHGRFRFDARGATAMLAASVELGGRQAEVSHGLDLTTGRSLAIEARWIDDILIHVLDATTRKELSGVRVSSCVYSPAAEHPGCPDLLTTVLEGERSPFHLLRETTIKSTSFGGEIWVGARDHAWKREKIDFDHEREHEVLLGPAGMLIIMVTERADAPPIDRRAPPRVRLRHPDREAGDPICDVAAEAGVIELDGLEPGDVVASIEIGDNFLQPLVLSRAATMIRADALSHVTLSLDPALAPKPTQLAGTAFVPRGWEESEDAYLEIELYPLGLRGGTREDERRTTRIALEPIAGRPGWHSWSVAPILPSKYRLVVPRAALETEVDVPVEGRDDVTLTLPEPAVLRVRVVDDATQQEVEVRMLEWRFTDTANFETVAIRRSDESGRCVGAVRPGRGRFEEPLFTGDVVEETDEEFTVHAGLNELILHAHAPCGVELVIKRDAGQTTTFVVKWSKSDVRLPGFLSLVTLHGGEDAQRESTHRIVLPGPGHYRFTLEHPPDKNEEFLFEVDVPKGEFVQKTITVDR